MWYTQAAKCSGAVVWVYLVSMSEHSHGSQAMAGVRIAIAWKYTYSYPPIMPQGLYQFQWKSVACIFVFWVSIVVNAIEWNLLRMRIVDTFCLCLNICPKYFTALLLANDWHWAESKLRKAVTQNNQSISSGQNKCYSMWPWFQISLSHIRHPGNLKQSHTCWWWITRHTDIAITRN